MRPGGEKRGSSTDRRRRKHWLLASFGDGVTCPCEHCSCSLDYATVEADRIIPGGSYRHENIQPACRSCNLARSDNVDWRPVSEVSSHALTRAPASQRASRRNQRRTLAALA